MRRGMKILSLAMCGVLALTLGACDGDSNSGDNLTAGQDESKSVSTSKEDNQTDQESSSSSDKASAQEKLNLVSVTFPDFKMDVPESVAALYDGSGYQARKDVGEQIEITTKDGILFRIEQYQMPDDEESVVWDKSSPSYDYDVSVGIAQLVNVDGHNGSFAAVETSNRLSDLYVHELDFYLTDKKYVVLFDYPSALHSKLGDYANTFYQHITF